MEPPGFFSCRHFNVFRLIFYDSFSLFSRNFVFCHFTSCCRSLILIVKMKGTECKDSHLFSKWLLSTAKTIKWKFFANYLCRTFFWFYYLLQGCNFFLFYFFLSLFSGFRVVLINSLFVVGCLCKIFMFSEIENLSKIQIFSWFI